ncbi:hypothetical protein HDV02_006116 [Globomyces sp. JEL0801]|nr:hypothetical protein HDV02_006116 [Globomyces sp. JEL0801]
MGITTSKFPTNDYELVITISKELEYILETEFQATGKGLHEKISSVESKLTNTLVKQMRYLATIRNKLIHQRDFHHIPDRNQFIANFESAMGELKLLISKDQASNCVIC